MISATAFHLVVWLAITIPWAIYFVLIRFV